MKTYNDRKKTIRIIIFLILFILSDILRVKSEKYNKSEGPWPILVIIEGILAINVILQFILIMKNPFRDFLKNSKSPLGKFLRWVLKPAIVRVIRIREKRKRFVKGNDKKKVVWNFNLSERVKKAFRLQERINLKRCTSNKERIRMMYIKSVLQLIDKGHPVSYSQTPKEVKSSLDSKEKDVLIDLYEQVRYNDNAVVSNDDMKKCEEANLL